MDNRELLAKPGAYEDILPSFEILAQVLLAIPITSVPWESGFSAQNRIHGALRNEMSPNAVECKMHIVHACKAPLDEESVCERAMKKFRSNRVRFRSLHRRSRKINSGHNGLHKNL